ncbi:MAG TPA: quinol:electron acceptor oxidoreductase subunit ActD [Syntrophorhabdaceae bacterium]|jgi:molybdopterin-containing oxidoreductase family membrane subunit
MPHREGLLVLFVYLNDFIAALKGLKGEKYRIEKVYTPIRLPEVEEIMAAGPSPARLVTLLGGILGGLATLGLAVYSHLSFNLITGGKPVLPWIPWVIVFFEGTVLGAVFAAVASWILMARLPRLRPDPGYDPRFSGDRFGILVSFESGEEGKIKVLLSEAGAEEVRHLTW